MNMYLTKQIHLFFIDDDVITEYTTDQKYLNFTLYFTLYLWIDSKNRSITRSQFYACKTYSVEAESQQNLIITLIFETVGRFGKVRGISQRKMSFHHLQLAKDSLQAAQAQYQTAKMDFIHDFESKAMPGMASAEASRDEAFKRQPVDVGTMEKLAESIKDELEMLKGETEKLHFRVKECEFSLGLNQNVSDLRQKLLTENPRSHAASSSASYGKSTVYESKYQTDRRAPLLTRSNRDVYVTKTFREERHDGGKHYVKKRYVPGAKYYKKYDN